MATDLLAVGPTSFDELQARFDRRPEQPNTSDPNKIHQHWKNFIEDVARSGEVRSISPADYDRVFQRLLGNTADLRGDNYQRNAWQSSGDHAKEYAEAKESNRLSAAWAILFSLRSGPRGRKPPDDRTRSGVFVPQFLRRPNHIHPDDIFEVYARCGGPADGIALVSGPRGSGKSQLLNDLASSAKAGPLSTAGISTHLKGGYLPLVVPSMDIGMAEDDAKKLSRDVIEEICVHAICHVQRVIPSRASATGSLLGETINEALLRFAHGLLLLARWCGVNLALFRLFTLLLLFVLGSTLILLKAPAVSWSATLQGGSDFGSQWGLGVIAGHFAGFLLGLLLVALATASAYRRVIVTWRQRKPAGRLGSVIALAPMAAFLALMVMLAYGLLLVCPTCNLPVLSGAAFVDFVAEQRVLLCLYLIQALIAVLGFAPLALWHRRHWGVHEMARLTPSATRLRAMAAASTLSIALVVATPLWCWTPPNDLAWAALAPMALPSLWMSVLAMPRYFIGLDTARRKLAQLQRRSEAIRDSGGIVASLHALLPEVEFRDLGQSTAALLQNELKELLADLGFAFERVLLFVDDVDVLPSSHYNDLMRIFRAATKVERVSVVMSVPTVFWHAYCSPRRNDIHSSVRDFWLLGSNELYVLASEWTQRTTQPLAKAVPLFDTMVANGSRPNESLILVSQVLVVPDTKPRATLDSQVPVPSDTKPPATLNVRVRNWLRDLLMTRSLILIARPPIDSRSNAPGDAFPQCLDWLLERVCSRWVFPFRGKPAPEQAPLRALVLAFGTSVREWLRFVERAIQHSALSGWETMRPVATQTITSAGELVAGHRIRVVETDSEWERCFATVLERDCMSEHMLDHDRRSKCHNGNCASTGAGPERGSKPAAVQTKRAHKRPRKRTTRSPPTPPVAPAPG